MKKIILLIVLLLACSSVAMCQGDLGEETPLFTFVQVTDLHVIADSPVNIIEKAIEKINSVEPAPRFVVATGDIINGEKPKESTEFYKKIFSGLKCPFYSVFGNHDNRFWYRKLLGDANYAFDVTPYHFIVLDDISPQGANETFGGKFPKKTTEWLKEHIETIDKKTPIILFCHASIFRNDGYSNKLPGDAYGYESVLEILKSYSVIAWFAGHAHANDLVHRSGVAYYTTGCLSDNRANGNCQLGYRIVEVYKNKVKTRYVPVK